MRENGLMPLRGDTVLCAVSGGLDSMCLLRFLHTLSKEHGFSLVAAHFEHGIRGDASLADADFVQTTAAEWGIPCRVGHGDAPALAKAEGKSLEEAARCLRYAFLDRTADACGASHIATAHHAEDNAETLLLHLIRGAGNTGLVGIAPARGRYVRPFLSLTREDLRVYAAENAVPFREDATNGDVRFSRNRLRLRVFPELRQINPGVCAALNRAAKVSRGENDYLTECARAALGTPAKPDASSFSVPLSRFYKADRRLWARMLSLLLDEADCGRKDFSAAHFEALSALIAAGKNGTHTDLPSARAADIRGGSLFLVRRETPPKPVSIAPGESVRFGDYTVSLRKGNILPRERGSVIRLSCAMINGELTVRTAGSGAGLRLVGSRGRRSLKRLMSDAGLSPNERRLLPVLYLGDTPVAAACLGADAAYAAEENGDAIELIIEKREETTP